VLNNDEDEDDIPELIDDNEDDNLEDDLIDILTQMRNNSRIREPTQDLQEIIQMQNLLMREMFIAMFLNNMMHARREQENLNRKFDILSSVVNDENENINENCECNICWEEKQVCNFVKLGCNHEFCKDCVIKSLRNEQRDKPCCALCRGEIKSLISRTNVVQTELSDLIA
jgi:hypothetical protein